MKDDGQLIDEALTGDTQAFGGLVRKYQNRLFSTLVRVTGCRQEAEDVAQEAFVQAYVKLETFKRNSAFYTWLYRIAFNLAVSRMRKRRPEVSVEAAREAGGVEPVQSGDAPSDRLERQEQAAVVQDALSALGEEHRVILVLREMEGFCYEQIAEVLDLPVGTVRSRLHRARLRMRDELKQRLQSHE